MADLIRSRFLVFVQATSFVMRFLIRLQLNVNWFSELMTWPNFQFTHVYCFLYKM